MFVDASADGMDALPAALAAALPPGTVRTGTAVRRIVRNEPVSPWLVELLDGPPIEADAVVLATEAHAAARLIDGRTRTWPCSSARSLMRRRSSSTSPTAATRSSTRSTASARSCRPSRAGRSWPSRS